MLFGLFFLKLKVSLQPEFSFPVDCFAIVGDALNDKSLANKTVCPSHLSTFFFGYLSCKLRNSLCKNIKWKVECHEWASICRYAFGQAHISLPLAFRFFFLASACCNLFPIDIQTLGIYWFSKVCQILLFPLISFVQSGQEIIDMWRGHSTGSHSWVKSFPGNWIHWIEKSLSQYKRCWSQSWFWFT